MLGPPLTTDYAYWGLDDTSIGGNQDVKNAKWGRLLGQEMSWVLQLAQSEVDEGTEHLRRMGWKYTSEVIRRLRALAAAVGGDGSQHWWGY